ncbi:MAG: chromate transporter [Clostridia bacterium]|nr:chromate transporter [Clostridia bacterium]
MKTLINLFIIFFKMGAVCFGGGYALLPIIQREIVNKYQYATEEEVADYFAIGQCTPGVIAANVATFIGHKQKGIVGGIVATLGFVMPSIIIIAIIAAFLQNFAESQIIKHAFAGIRICVCVLIINAVMSFGKKSVIDAVTAALCGAVFVLASFTHISPAVLVICCGIIGAVVKGIGGRSK